MAWGALSSLALPLETVLVPLIAADLFGEKEYAKMMGLFVSVNTAGYALGGPIANWMQGVMGSYKVALLGMSGMMVLILLAFQFALTAAGKDRKKILAAAQ